MTEQEQPGAEFQPFSAEHNQTVDMYTRFRTFLGKRDPETSKTAHRTLSMTSHEITNLDGELYSRVAYLPRLIDFTLDEMSTEHPVDTKIIRELAAGAKNATLDDETLDVGQVIASAYNERFYDGLKWRPAQRREQLHTARLRYNEEPFVTITDRFRTMLTQHGLEDTYADDVLAALSYWYDAMDIVGYRNIIGGSTSGAA